MAEGTTDESDGLEDVEFLAEHEKYIEDCAKHTFEILKAEADRQDVSSLIFLFANVITASSRNDKFCRYQST